jgi:5'(3')-deoxyribonucleotidase
MEKKNNIPRFDPAVNTIHLDMDGVLADFDRFVLERMGRVFPHQEGPSDREMWDFLATVDHLYFQLEPTSYALDLFHHCNEIAPVKILTAIPRRTSMPHAEQDKRDWIAKYIGPGVHVAIGPYSRDKFKHCNPGDILIDDRADNIEAWGEKGLGHGILHITNNVQDTYDKLAKVLAAV